MSLPAPSKNSGKSLETDSRLAPNWNEDIKLETEQ